MSDMVQASSSAPEAVSNVVPLPSKVKADKGGYQGSSKLLILLHHILRIFIQSCGASPFQVFTCKLFKPLLQALPLCTILVVQHSDVHVKANSY